jgi:hypothetical protein
MTQNGDAPEGDLLEVEARPAGAGVVHSMHGDPTSRVFRTIEEFFEYLNRDRGPAEGDTAR